MADWKKKGYVPDSDSDSDSDSQEFTTVGLLATPLKTISDGGQDDVQAHRREVCGTDEHTQPHSEGILSIHVDRVSSSPPGTERKEPQPSDIAADQGAQARRGITEQDEATEGRISPEFPNSEDPLQQDAENISGSSSPLSDIPSSLPDLTDLLPAFLEDIVHEDNNAGRDSLAQNASLSRLPEDDDRFHRGNSRVPHTSGRSFRRRNAIQLHPYIIEKEKYYRAWRSRGLKPVHILQEEGARLREQEDETQNFECSDQGDAASPTPLHNIESSPLEPSLRQNPPGSRVDEEFPDIDALFQTKPPAVTAGTYKRRKLNSNLKKPPAAPPLSQASSQTPDLIASQDAITNSDTPIVSSLSPNSQSSQVISHPEAPRFRVPPRNKSPRPRNMTPRFDSSKEQSSNLANDAEKGSTTESLNEGNVSEASDPTNSSDEELVSKQIKHAQRRIKGVLPASWLKLDLRAKTSGTQRQSKHGPSSPPQISAKKRGVARPIARISSKPPGSLQIQAEILEISDISENDGFHSDAVDTSIGAADQGDNVFVNRLGEATESDFVDAMLPAARRAKVSANRPKSRGRKVGAGRDQNKETRPKRPTTVHSSRLSVLDMTAQQATESTAPPSFMKIARRTARLRHDQGRHSPSRKYLRMATNEDTEALDETMHKWREGTILPSFPSDVQQRQPLQPRSGNNALPFNARRPPVLSERPKNADRETKSVQKRPRLSRPRNLQTSLGYLIHQKVRQPRNRLESSEMLPHNLHQNRSGVHGSKPSLGLKTSNDSRPAILELSQSRESMEMQNSSSNGLSKFGKLSRSDWSSKPVLDRFLQLEDPTVTPGNEKASSSPPRAHSNMQKRDASRKFRGKKRNPKRVYEAAVPSRQSKLLSTSEKTYNDEDHLHLHDGQLYNRVEGLGSFGTRYSTGFDIKPLPPGVSFKQRTFLGSGDFAKSLLLRGDSSLDAPRSTTAMAGFFNGCKWGVWNETVASQIGEVFDCIVDSLRNSAGSDPGDGNLPPLDPINLLAAVAKYFSEHLTFAVPVDRITFLRRCKSLLSDFLSGNSRLVRNITEDDVIDHAKLQNGARISSLGLVLTAQVHQISEHHIVPSELSFDIHALLVESNELALALVQKGLKQFEEWQVEFWRLYRAGHSMQISNAVIEAFVVTRHVIQRTKIRSLELLECVLPHGQVAGMMHLASRERIWQECFTLLPFLEFDERGALDPGRRFKEPTNSWDIVKRLMTPILEMYINNPRGQAASFNEYCRSIFSRCLHLMNEWAWYGCDSIIGLLFDFFAKNNLGHLRNEECHGSPLFLENLAQNPALDVEPEDRCFHLLLKIIGSGLRHMQQSSPLKKIRDLVWRLMPNHGRSHPKEQSIRQVDIDALRNHHDLLSTLYWASPPKFRPSLNAIRTLVDLDQSHREACHVNIRTWSNLVNFQLSTDEPLENVLPFTHWHSDFLSHMLRQHDHARSEAEEQLRSVQYVKGLSVSMTTLESNIAKNQRQVEVTLIDALTCLELAITAAKSPEAAGLLLSPTLARLLERPERLANEVIFKALGVLAAYAGRCSKRIQQSGCRDENEESQDYGDWSAFLVDDGLNDEQNKKASGPLIQMTGPLRTLLSNYFGADKAPADSLLIKLVDTWVAVSWVLVDDGVKSYDDYLGPFGNDAWCTLRDTSQTRKYAPYFYAAFIKTDAQVFQSCRLSILSCWLGSLVQYESWSTLQHNLTSSLLNANLEDPLFHNLPFWINAFAPRFNITAVEFSERRLSTISSVLSNMRTSLELADFKVEVNASQIRQEYKNLLRHVMMTMKDNYVELAQDSNAKLHYTDFVQHVVEHLQEHTSNICPVDRFFTDGNAFPSPKYDPNYIVGQLKNYGLRLSDPKTPKQLAVFLQSVSELALVNDHQANFVEQLHGAMSSSLDPGPAKSQLLEFVTVVIVPAYLRLAFENPIGWALASPFLKACQKIFTRIHLSLDGSHVDTVAMVTTTILTFLVSMRTASAILINHSSSFATTNVLTTLTLCFETVTLALPTLDYAVRFGSPADDRAALNHIAFFKAFSTFTHTQITSAEDAAGATMEDVETSSSLKDTRYEGAFDFTVHELRNKLQSNWSHVGEDHFITQGSSRRRVRIKNGDFVKERDSLRLALHKFGTRLSTLPALGGWPDWRAIARGGQESTKEELLIF